MAKHVLLLFFGQFAAALSIFFIRASQLAPGYLATARLMLTIIITLPLFIRDAGQMSVRGGKENAPLSPGKLAVHLISHSFLPGLMLGLHFVFWNMGARMTLAANATMLVNLTPLCMPLAVFLLEGEKPLRLELLATAIAMSGALVLTAGGVALGAESLTGDILTFISMIFLTAYLALSKKNRSLPFWYYISAVYFFGALTAGLVSLLRGDALVSPQGWLELLPVAGLTLVSTLIGHNLINRSMRILSSQIVGVAQLSQFLWAGFLAWIISGEIPAPRFYPAMILIIMGNLLVLHAHRGKRPSQNPRLENVHEADMP